MNTLITNMPSTDFTGILPDDLSQPMMIQQQGQPVAVLMSLTDYEHYQTLLAQQKILSEKEMISARDARRKACKIVFGDLVGCPLNVGEPIFTNTPEAVWKVPFYLFDETLVHIVVVNANTGQVSLSEVERQAMFQQVSNWVSQNQNQLISDAA